MQAAPAYFFQRRLDGLYCIYDDRGPVEGYEDIDCIASAEGHIAELEAADRAREEQEAAQLAADHAEAERQISIDLTLSEIEASIAALIHEAA